MQSKEIINAVFFFYLFINIIIYGKKKLYFLSVDSNHRASFFLSYIFHSVNKKEKNQQKKNADVIIKAVWCFFLLLKEGTFSWKSLVTRTCTWNRIHP